VPAPADLTTAESPKGYGRYSRLERLDFEDHVVEWIEKCREAGGIPMFRTKYGDIAFLDEKGRPMLMGVCWLRSDEVPSVWFQNVPEKAYKKAANYLGEWRWFLWKYGGGEERGEPEPVLRPKGVGGFLFGGGK